VWTARDLHAEAVAKQQQQQGAHGEINSHWKQQATTKTNCQSAHLVANGAVKAREGHIRIVHIVMHLGIVYSCILLTSHYISHSLTKSSGTK